MSQRPAAVPEPDEIAGRYQIVQKLGAGAFGTVYKAKDRLLGRMVAIKTIRLEGLAAAGASLEELVNRFKREAQVSAQLKHPNIVTIYDIGESGGISYLAMEFIDGVGLDRVISAAGRLPVERAASLAAQVADAVDFAHRHNVVHRDIKPANIMVESGDRVKVTDFGIARVTDSVDNLTATGSLLGTPSYMSPEQARGTAIDGRSDLFAVGCILYEMVVGKKAFRGDSITGLIFKIITEEPPPMRELEPSVPDEVIRIVARALAKSPESRYQTGREMADDLLALTRPGSTPTLRQSEVGTAPGLPSPAGLPTLNVPGTMSGSAPTNVPAGATARTPAAAPPTTLMPPPPPPGDPTRVSSTPPPLPRTAAPRPPRPAAQAAPVRPIPPSAEPKSRTGLFVALGVVGLFVLAALGAGAIFVLRPKAPVTESAPPPAPTAAPATLSTAAPVTTLPPIVAAAEPSAPAPSAAAAVHAPSRPASTGGAATAAAATRAAPPPVAASPATTPARPEPTRDLFDAPPAVDGREAGQRAAEGYRTEQGSTNNGSFGTNRRFRPREKFPPDVTAAERRGVFVLLNVIHYEALHHQRTGRYGTFQQVLPRQMGSPTSFEHASYRFDMTVESDGYKVVATPLAPGLRGFVADDSGFVRYADE